MHLDVVDLRAFYYRTQLGRLAQRALQEALRRLWPETRGLTVVGYGFAAPMLRPFLADARRVARPDAEPAGGHALAARRPQRRRPGRGDPLADRGRLRRPPDRRPRPRDLRAPRRAPRRDLARPRPGRPRGLHRPQPLRPLGPPRRHALRLRPPLQPRPARGRPPPATASSPSAMPAPSTRRRPTAASGSSGPTSGSASAAASTRAPSPAPFSSRHRSRSTPGRPAARKVTIPGPLDVLEGLAGPARTRRRLHLPRAPLPAPARADR